MIVRLRRTATVEDPFAATLNSRVVSVSPVSSVVDKSLFRELHGPLLRIYSIEDVMKAYLANLPMRTWFLLVLPLVAIGYPVARIVVPAVLHAVVPEVVRSVLNVI